MLDMGFRPPVDRIVAQCPADRQTLFFSATLDGEAGEIAREYTNDAVTHEHVPPVEKTADIEHRFVRVEGGDRIDTLLHQLRSAERELALVFVRTKRGADRLVKRLGNEGHARVAMHGDKSQRQREKALAQFESGRVDTLVATDVAARGIDVDGISHVINFDPPEDREGYVHRIGRTGRAGSTGVGITYVGSEHAADMSKIARDLELEREFAASGHVVSSGAPVGPPSERRRRRRQPSAAGPARPRLRPRRRLGRPRRPATASPAAQGLAVQRRQARRRQRQDGRLRAPVAVAAGASSTPPDAANVPGTPSYGGARDVRALGGARRRATAVSETASSGRAMWKPWPVSQPSAATQSSASAVSRPSATTEQPRLCPSSIVERMIATSRSSASIRAANERSILISSIGSSRSRLSDE